MPIDLSNCLLDVYFCKRAQIDGEILRVIPCHSAQGMLSIRVASDDEGRGLQMRNSFASGIRQLGTLLQLLP